MARNQLADFLQDTLPDGHRLNRNALLDRISELSLKARHLGLFLEASVQLFVCLGMTLGGGFVNDPNLRVFLTRDGTVPDDQLQSLVDQLAEVGEA